MMYNSNFRPRTEDAGHQTWMPIESWLGVKYSNNFVSCLSVLRRRHVLNITLYLVFNWTRTTQIASDYGLGSTLILTLGLFCSVQLSDGVKIFRIIGMLVQKCMLNSSKH